MLIHNRRNTPKSKVPDAEPMSNPNESLNLLRKMLQMRNKDDISFEELGDILFDVADEFEPR